MKTEIKKLPKSTIEVGFELDEVEFGKYVEKALEHLKSHVKVDGFRKGNVPKEIAEKKIGQENLLMEAGDLAVKESYAKFVNENNLEPVSQPEVQITKIAKGSPMQFTVRVAVLPEVTLPDYKAIAAKVKVQDVAVEEKEIQEALEYLQKSRATFTDKTTGAENKDYIKLEYQNEHINGGKPVRDMFILGEGGFLPDFEQNLLGMKTGEEKEFSAKFPEGAPKEVAGKEGVFKAKMLAVQTMGLPEINDELAKQLGAFDSLTALKENLKEGIGLEKQEAEKQRRRNEILNKIGEVLVADLPETMVAYEQEKLVDHLKQQVASQFKIPFEEYLKSAKKTEEEVRQSYAKEAERRIKNFMVLREIGKQEKVEVSKEEIEEEMNNAIKHYPKEQLDKIDINRLREYSKGVIYDEKVFQKLEGFSQ